MTMSLGEVEPVVVYLTIPVVIDGNTARIDTTDDGDPGSWGDCYDYNNVEQGLDGWRSANSEELDRAWGVFSDMRDAADMYHELREGL